MTNREFIEIIWRHYDLHGRHDLSWRQPESDGSFDPYKIVVSELMLQQTQVSRVKLKYLEFLAQFPTVHHLAAAELAEVLKAWSGLGYNRRAKYLWQTAVAVHESTGQFPDDREGLITLPGIGKNTAGAVLAYAFNKPSLFIETNVRTVYIHHFFHDQVDVSDADILSKLAETIDREHSREFYWALMDYGSFLKKTVGNVNRVSKEYKKQSRFEGSKRQIRGEVLRRLATAPLTSTELGAIIPDERLPAVMQDLLSEDLIKSDGDKFTL